MLLAFVFLFGLSVGSFLNVVICRLETKNSIFFSRSHCPECGAVLKCRHLIPLLSFLIQKGRCSYCGQKISWQYPLVELTTGLLFLLIFNFQFSISNQFSILNSQTLILLYYLAIVCFLIIIFVYDLKHYIIPDKILFPAVIIAVLYRLFEILNFNNWGNWGLFKNWQLAVGNLEKLANPFIAGAGAAFFFLLLVLVSKGKWMGLGDVKLVFLMGLVLGWPNILAALFLSFLTGAIAGLVLIVLGRKTMKSEIPFGPFLTASTIIILVFGNLLAEKLFFEFF
jgi:leader peptidase (prepilin peptidase)/N-methyltransferase